MVAWVAQLREPSRKKEDDDGRAGGGQRTANWVASRGSGRAVDPINSQHRLADPLLVLSRNASPLFASQVQTCGNRPLSFVPGVCGPSSIFALLGAASRKCASGRGHYLLSLRRGAQEGGLRGEKRVFVARGVRFGAQVCQVWGESAFLLSICGNFGHVGLQSVGERGDDNCPKSC